MSWGSLSPSHGGASCRPRSEKQPQTVPKAPSPGMTFTLQLLRSKTLLLASGRPSWTSWVFFLGRCEWGNQRTTVDVKDTPERRQSLGKQPQLGAEQKESRLEGK